MDALDFAPAGIKQAIVDKAVALEIPDMTRREAIEKAMHVNISRMIENKKVMGKEESSVPAQRRRVKTSSQNKSRRVKKEAAE